MMFPTIVSKQDNLIHIVKNQKNGMWFYLSPLYNS